MGGVSAYGRSGGLPLCARAADVAVAPRSARGIGEALVPERRFLLACDAFVDARDHKERRPLAACGTRLVRARGVLRRLLRALRLACGAGLALGAGGRLLAAATEDGADGTDGAGVITDVATSLKSRLVHSSLPRYTQAKAAQARKRRRLA